MKKGPPENQRPKSREETPKEGYGASRSRCDKPFILLQRTNVNSIFAEILTLWRRGHTERK